MKRILVDIVDPVDKVPKDLLEKEYAHANELKAKGILNHLFVKSDKTGAFLVMTAEDIEKAKEVVATYPMFPYYEKVEYTYIDENF